MRGALNGRLLNLVKWMIKRNEMELKKVAAELKEELELEKQKNKLLESRGGDSEIAELKFLLEQATDKVPNFLLDRM